MGSIERVDRPKAQWHGSRSGRAAPIPSRSSCSATNSPFSAARSTGRPSMMTTGRCSARSQLLSLVGSATGGSSHPTRCNSTPSRTSRARFSLAEAITCQFCVPKWPQPLFDLRSLTV